MVLKKGDLISLLTERGKLPGEVTTPTRFGAVEIRLDGDPFDIWTEENQVEKRKVMAKKKVEEEVVEEGLETYTKKELQALPAKELAEVAEDWQVEDFATKKKPELIKDILAAQEAAASDEEDEDEDELEFEDEEDEDSDESDEDEEEDEDEDDEEDEEEDEEDEDLEEDEEDEEEEEEEEELPKSKAAAKKKRTPPTPRRAAKDKVKPGQNPWVTSTQKGAIAEVVIKRAGKKAWRRGELIDALIKSGVQTRSKKRQGVAARMNRALKDLEDLGWTLYQDGPNSSDNQVIAVWHPEAGQEQPKVPTFKESAEDKERREARSANLKKAQEARGKGKTKAAKTTKTTKATTTTAKKGAKSRSTKK